MSLSSTTNRLVYVGDGSSATFAFPYYFFTQSDLKVYLYDTISGSSILQSLNTHYTITGSVNANGLYASGGNVVMASSVINTTDIVIVRAPTETQNFVLQQNAVIPSAALTQQLDYLTLLVQRQNDKNKFTVRLPDGYAGAFDPSLPSGLGTFVGQALTLNGSATGWTFGAANLGYIPNTVIYAPNGSSIASLGGGPAGYVLQSNGSSAPTWAAVSLSGSSVSGNLSLSNGGTGGLTPQTWGVVFASSATQLATTDPAPVGFALISNASSAPKFQQFNFATAGSGFVAIANGGTGQATAVSAFSALSPLTTAGDVIIYGSNAAAVRLAAGAANFALVSNGAATQPSYKAVLLLSGGTMTGSVNFGAFGLSNAADPTSAQDVATKNYVDTVSSALNPIQGVALASASTNYPGIMVGNVLTITATGAISVDGSAPAANARILLKDQSTGAQNGVYVVTGVGSVGVSPVLTRAADYNTAAAVNAGDLVPVIGGTANATTSWLQTSTIVTINVDSLVFVQWTANPANYLLKANNLSDVTSKPSSWKNLSPTTTWGDFIYAGSGAVGTALAAGSTGFVLTTQGVGANPIWTSALSNPMTTFGDIIYAGSANVVTRLVAGASGQVLQTNGSSAAPSWATFNQASLTVSSKTANYNAATSDDLILVSSSNFNVNLYGTSGNSGRQIRIKKTDSNMAFNITVAGSNATIDGATTVNLSTPNEEYHLVCDGTNWQIEQHYSAVGWTVFSGSGTWVANTSYTAKWRRYSDMCEMAYNINCQGAPTAATLTVNTPPGVAVNIANLTGSSGTLSQNVFVFEGGGLLVSGANRTRLLTGVYGSGSSNIGVLTVDALGGGAINATTPVTFNSSSFMNLFVRFPVLGWTP